MIRDMLEALAGLGYPIFPCVRKDKAPLTANGYKDATTDMVTIDRWLKIHTDCNWAIAVPDTVIVLDIDSLDGRHPLHQWLCPHSAVIHARRGILLATGHGTQPAARKTAAAPGLVVRHA